MSTGSATPQANGTIGARLGSLVLYVPLVGLEAERIGPHVGTEPYGISSVSPGLIARPPGNTDNGSPRRRTYPRLL